MKKDVAIQCGDDPEIPNHVWRIHNKKIEILGEKPAVAEVSGAKAKLITNLT